MSKTVWSIIIPAFNEERLIGACLDSICAMEYDLASVEVVLADNGSTDRTVSIALGYRSRLHVEVLTVPGVPVGALRNAAAAQAKGAALAFLDSDCLVGRDWLTNASRVIGSHPGMIVGAHYALPPDAGWPARLWSERFHEGRSGPVSYLPGGNLIMERATFNKLDGFDPQLRSNEDSQLCSRARAAGIQVVAFPELATVHLGAEKNWRHFVRRQLWHGSNVVNQAGLKGNAKAIGLAAYTMICVIGMVVAVVLWQPLSFLMGFAALLMPPTLMAMQGPSGLRQFGKLFPMIGLLLTYALVRAYVLPLALLRGVRQWRWKTAIRTA